MKRRILHTGILFLLTISGVTTRIAQRRSSGSPPKPAPSVLSALPQSDAVALIKTHRLLDEALPKILAQNQAKLADVNNEIEKFKTQTGVDARAFDELALGMRYSYPRQGVTKVDTVAVARGTFNAGAFAGAGRNAGEGKYREESYQGRTIYVFTLDRQLKLFGLTSVRVHELALTPLALNVLAIGSPDAVRKAIDAGGTRRGSNAELIALATRDPAAIIGFGGNFTTKLTQNLGIENEANKKDLASIKQVFGSVGATEKNLEVLIAARATDPAAAKNLSQTLTDLTALAAFAVSRMPAPRGTVARSALNNLKITTQENELQIRTTVAQGDVGPLMKGQ